MSLAGSYRKSLREKVPSSRCDLSFTGICGGVEELLTVVADPNNRRVPEIGFALIQKGNSGHVGLLGLSNGGFLAVGTGAIDQRIGALVVFYGGIARPIRGEITRLPPLLELHGDADRTIPITQGRALVDRAKALGGEAEQIVYPGAGHGFGPTSDDARGHAVDFLRHQLNAD